MKIQKLFLENFRCFYGIVEIPMNDFTVFIGKNDQGKSTILEAIDLFIYEGEKGHIKIDEEDLNKKAKNEGKEEFKIGISFKDFPDTSVIIDATNPTTLKDEYLLSKEGFLEIWKVFKKGKVKETFLRCKHPVNNDFLRKLITKKISELQSFVRDKRIDTSDIDERKSADLRKVIRSYFLKKDGTLNFEEIDIKIDEEGLKDIWNKLKNYLPVYALFHSDRKNIDQDDEIQDPLKAKVEEIFRRKKIQEQLKKISEEIDKELKEIAAGTIEKFRKLSRQKLTIKPNIPDVSSLKWKDVYKKLGFVTDNEIPLNKRGSGIRRIVLVSSFLAEVERKLNSKDNTHSDNHIIYAIEEPETSLHPDLQIILINTLQKLSRNGNYQVFMSTHSPALIRLFEISSIRYVEQCNGDTKVENFNKEVANKIIKNLGLLPNIGKVVICVEGTNDENFLMNINQHIPELKEIINLKDGINSGLVAIIPMYGSNVKDWINRDALKNTNVLEFFLCDRDDDEKYREKMEQVKQRGGFAKLTNKREIENYIPKEIIEEEFGIQIILRENENWNDIDIPNKIKEKVSLSEKKIKKRLCREYSKKITKEHLEKLNAWEEVKGWFEKIKELTEKTWGNR